MSSATERAAARRKAILARGNDRLAKLTTSARGEDAPAYVHDDPPLAPLPNRPDLKEFVGEQTALPTPPPLSRSVSDSHTPPFQSAGLGNNPPDPSVWSPEQQQQLLNALMGGAQGAAPLPGQPRLPPNADGIDTPDEDPFAALMSSLVQPGGQGQSPFNLAGMQAPGAGFAQASAPRKPKTLLQKIMPLIHLVAAWALLAYFVIWKEPETYDAQMHGSFLAGDRWRRWAELGWKSPGDGWGVQTVPFFWAFTTLTIILHSWRIFSGVDRVRPPTLIALALPHLPAPFPSLILNGMKYLQIGGVFLDDIAGLLVVIGLLVWIASWVVK